MLLGGVFECFEFEVWEIFRFESSSLGTRMSSFFLSRFALELNSGEALLDYNRLYCSEAHNSGESCLE